MKPFSFADLPLSNERSLQSKDTHEIADFKSHLGPENFFSKGNDPNDDEEAAGDYPDHMKRFIDDIVDSSDNVPSPNLYDGRETSFPPGLTGAQQFAAGEIHLEFSDHSDLGLVLKTLVPSQTLGNTLKIPGFSLATHNGHSSHSGNNYNLDGSFNSGKNSSSQRSHGRKGSYKTTSQGPMYNIQINDDICLLERIESAINSISTSFNPFCPLCLKYIDLKRINFQNVSAYYSKSTKKHYLTHFDCYHKASKSPSWKLRVLSDIPDSKIAPIDNVSSHNNEILALPRADKKIMFINLEGVHPIGGAVLFRIEKAVSVHEDTLSNNYVFFHDLEKHIPSLYEPNNYVLPFTEFICKVIVTTNFTNEEPSSFEFMVNAFQVLSTADQNAKPYEISHREAYFQATLGVNVVLDNNQELINGLNYKLPGYETQTASDSQKSRVLVLKYIKICVPIIKKARQDVRKVSSNTKDMSSIKIDEGEEFDLLDTPMNQKKKTKDMGTLSNLDEQFSENLEKGGRTFGSIESPITNGSKNIQSFSSCSPISILEGSFNNRAALHRNNEASQFSHFAAYANQHNNSAGNSLLNKTGESLPAGNSLLYGSDLQSGIGGGTTSNSLSCLEEEGKSNSGIAMRTNPQSLTFIPNFEQNNQSELFADTQQFRLSDYKGKIGELAQNPSGSKMIQQFIPKATSTEIDAIISELIPALQDIMLDPYSNYMLTTLLQHSLPEQRASLFKNIVPLIPSVARHKKGTHSLQSIVGLVKGDEEEELFEQSLHNCALTLAKDPYGTHFVQKVVNTFSMKRINFIFNAIICNFVEIAQHSHCLCVLKAMISKTEKDTDKKKLIIQLTAKHLDELIQNAFGNYAIQHAFEVYKEDCREIWDKISLKPIAFCSQKYSANVIDKCLETASLESRKKFIEAVVRNEKFIELMTNKYGNFALQKIFDLSEDSEKKLFLGAIIKSIDKIHSNKHRTRWISFLEECQKSGKYDNYFQNVLTHQQGQQQLQMQQQQVQSQQLFQPQQQMQHNGLFHETNQFSSKGPNPKKLSLKNAAQPFNMSFPTKEDNLFVPNRQAQTSLYQNSNVNMNFQPPRSFPTQQNWNGSFQSYPVFQINPQTHGPTQMQIQGDVTSFQGFNGSTQYSGGNTFYGLYQGPK